jgi:predicted transcriptional regulator
MKIESADILDEQSKEIIELLQNLGVGRTEAISIACLSCGKEITSQDIEQASGMRQPEVSVAMRPLRERGWIEERNEKKNSDKGRPVKYYKLTVPLREIIETFEEEIRQRNREMEETLRHLKGLKNSESKKH